MGMSAQGFALRWNAHHSLENKPETGYYYVDIWPHIMYHKTCTQERETLMNEMVDETLDARVDALKRLISIAKNDSGQCRICADFLLAWWNAQSCGGFDLTDFWAVDNTIAEDMLAVCGLISSLRGSYPNNLGLREDFHDIMRRWRPKLMKDAEL